MKKSSAFVLGSVPSLEELAAVAEGRRRLALVPAARARMNASRRRLLKAAAAGDPVYGVNTGFAELASKRIPSDQLAGLQRNLVRSHACGVGELLSIAEARAMLWLRANELARGYSGVRPELVEMMSRLYNAGVVPAVPSRGSLGASGDLAPQAHVALLLIGEGRALEDGRPVSAKDALRRAGLKPFTLEAKEGLSLLNGTQGMQAVGGLALRRAQRVLDAAQLAGAASLEAMTGTPVPFEADIHRLKPHRGQVECARGLRELLKGSEIRESHRENDPRVQDPYSLRCMPQVHGAVLDVLHHSISTVETELASVTDNPIIAGGSVLSGGNFHGQALSFAFDSAAAALTALGNISERRIFQLILGSSPRLNIYLARNPGLESGWMIPQYVAAALASENKTLAHPASADSIPSSANKEDFVSMGMWAALKLKQVVSNAAQIVAIELLCAAQGVEVHAPLRPGKGVAEGLKRLRARVRPAEGDEALGPRMELVRDMILEGYFE
ncbi:MAG: histidine ammonia-lyase [Elusimicrobia bacterium]|nr:histidine ammonia-lyase [Elusimicrobiota bacterium]